METVIMEEDAPERVAAEPRALRASHVAPRPGARMRIEAFGSSDVGLLRTGNEDSFAVLHDIGLFMVADGMGGAAAGEVASRMAIDCVREAFENPDMTWPASMSERPRGGPDASLLIAGIQYANARIFNIAHRYADKRGMGTTFAGLLALRDRLVIAHVGDSRVYRLRSGRLDLLTEDHSMLNACIQAGTWDPEESDTFPYPNMITRAVGADNELSVETRVDVPHPGDVYLICSDGLHGVLDDHQLATVLLEEKDLTLAVAHLIALANDNGGPDNITAVLIRVAGSAAR